MGEPEKNSKADWGGAQGGGYGGEGKSEGGGGQGGGRGVIKENAWSNQPTFLTRKYNEKSKKGEKGSKGQGGGGANLLPYIRVSIEEGGKRHKRSRSDMEREDENIDLTSANDNVFGEVGPSLDTMGAWGHVTGAMESIHVELNKLKSDGNGDIVKEVCKGFSALERHMNTLSDKMFNMAEKVDWLLAKDEQVGGFLENNMRGGNLTTQIETSKGYTDLCGEVKNASCITKIFGVDLGEETEGRDKIVKKSKKVLEEEKKIHLKGAAIVPLKFKSAVFDRKHTAPVLIISKDREEKKTLERQAKDRGYRTGFHWPKNIVPLITKMREQLEEFKSDNLDLTDKHILIRPNMTGNSLSILYRPKEKIKDFWTHLESVKVPADDKLVRLFNAQPCQSKYFSL